MIGSTIAQTLKARRLTLGLSQQIVAERGGTDQTAYSKIERGKTNPRLTTLQDIGRAMSLEMMMIPVELADSVKALIGQDVSPKERPLFSAEPD